MLALIRLYADLDAEVGAKLRRAEVAEDLGRLCQLQSAEVIDYVGVPTLPAIIEAIDALEEIGRRQDIEIVLMGGINRIAVPDAPPEHEDHHTRDVHYVPAPCQVACPIGTDAPSYIAYIWDEDYEGAFEAITATNPFSSICGRVCDAPCEPACRRVDSDGAVQIRNPKRFVMDKLGATDQPGARGEARGRIAPSGAVDPPGAWCRGHAIGHRLRGCRDDDRHAVSSDRCTCIVDGSDGTFFRIDRFRSPPMALNT